MPSPVVSGISPSLLQASRSTITSRIAKSFKSGAIRNAATQLVHDSAIGTHFKTKEELEKRQGPSEKINYVTAVNKALHIAMDSDPNSVIFGEDVGFGGVFRCAVGLRDKFGRDRVFNAPISEQGIIGFGIGLAATGKTALAEIQFADYIFPGFDQIVNEAAKFRFRAGGTWDCGALTIRTPCGAVGHGGLYHSQSPEAYFTHASGLKVVCPRGPYQAKGLLLRSIRTEDPVLFLEPKTLYRAAEDLVPLQDYELPLGKGELVKEGKDLTVVAWGSQVYRAAHAIARIEKEMQGVSIELIDLQSLLPWDAEMVEQSVKKTGKLLITHEAPQTQGCGAEIAAEVQERCFYDLHQPIQRVCGFDTPFPMSQETVYIPTPFRVHQALSNMLKE